MAQALPTYTMSCFKLPNGLCHDIEALVRKFYGGQRGESQKVHWTKWADLCKLKAQGGMGFKIFQGSTMPSSPNKLSTFYTIKPHYFIEFSRPSFFQNYTIMEATNPSSASYMWKSIIKGREVIKRGAVWRIGDGRSTTIWGEHWLSVKHSPKIVLPCTGALADAKVSALIDQKHRTWKEEVLDANLLSFEANMIKKIPLCYIDQADTLTWPFNPTGEYTVKLGYTFL